MDNVNLWISIITGLLGLAVLVASTIAIIRVSYFKAQVEALRGDRDDLNIRVDLLEKDKERIEAKASALELALQKETEKVQVLETIVTAKDELFAISNNLSKLIRVVDAHHRDTMILLGGKRATDTEG